MTTKSSSAMAAALEDFVHIEPIVMRDYPDAHRVTFDVDSQHFDISPHGCETKEDAEWMRKMFLIALSKAFAKHMQIPEGWVLVPKEPTHEMIKSAEKAFQEECYRVFDDGDVVPVYKAMLSAAPPKGGGDHESTGATTGGKP